MPIDRLGLSGKICDTLNEIISLNETLVEELTQAGVLLATGGLSMTGTHMSASGGRVTMTDGPYAEAKETIVSFALLDVRTKEEAVELSRRFWAIVKDGEGDIRQVLGPEG